MEDMEDMDGLERFEYGLAVEEYYTILQSAKEYVDALQSGDKNTAKEIADSYQHPKIALECYRFWQMVNKEQRKRKKQSQESDPDWLQKQMQTLLLNLASTLGNKRQSDMESDRLDNCCRSYKEDIEMLEHEIQKEENKEEYKVPLWKYFLFLAPGLLDRADRNNRKHAATAELREMKTEYEKKLNADSIKKNECDSKVKEYTKTINSYEDKLKYYKDCLKKLGCIHMVPDEYYDFVHDQSDAKVVNTYSEYDNENDESIIIQEPAIMSEMTQEEKQKRAQELQEQLETMIFGMKRLCDTFNDYKTWVKDGNFKKTCETLEDNIKSHEDDLKKTTGEAGRMAIKRVIDFEQEWLNDADKIREYYNTHLEVKYNDVMEKCKNKIMRRKNELEELGYSKLVPEKYHDFFKKEDIDTKPRENEKNKNAKKISCGKRDAQMEKKEIRRMQGLMADVLHDIDKLRGVKVAYRMKVKSKKEQLDRLWKEMDTILEEEKRGVKPKNKQDLNEAMGLLKNINNLKQEVDRDRNKVLMYNSVLIPALSSLCDRRKNNLKIEEDKLKTPTWKKVLGWCVVVPGIYYACRDRSRLNNNENIRNFRDSLEKAQTMLTESNKKLALHKDNLINGSVEILRSKEKIKKLGYGYLLYKSERNNEDNDLEQKTLSKKEFKASIKNLLKDTGVSDENAFNEIMNNFNLDSVIRNFNSSLSATNNKKSDNKDDEDDYYNDLINNLIKQNAETKTRTKEDDKQKDNNKNKNEDTKQKGLQLKQSAKIDNQEEEEEEEVESSSYEEEYEEESGEISDSQSKKGEGIDHIKVKRKNGNSRVEDKNNQQNKKNGKSRDEGKNNQQNKKINTSNAIKLTLKSSKKQANNNKNVCMNNMGS